jgi:hypothetical protein
VTGLPPQQIAYVSRLRGYFNLNKSPTWLFYQLHILIIIYSESNRADRRVPPTNLTDGSHQQIWQTGPTVRPDKMSHRPTKPGPNKADRTVPPTWHLAPPALEDNAAKYLAMGGVEPATTASGMDKPPPSQLSTCVRIESSKPFNIAPLGSSWAWAAMASYGPAVGSLIPFFFWLSFPFLFRF